MIEEKQVQLKQALNTFTGIKRQVGQKTWQNYYYNLEMDCLVTAIFGDRTVVFWTRDGEVIRGFFLTADLEECKKLLNYLPIGTIVEYVTAKEENLGTFFNHCGFDFVAEFQRMTEEREEREKPQNKKFWEKYSRFYNDKAVRLATREDLDELTSKIYEIFDVRDGHLPNREYLLDLIESGWVVVYYLDSKLLAFHIFTVSKSGGFYGYLIWNGASIAGLISIELKTREIYSEYLAARGLERDHVPAPYCWVNVKNEPAIKLSMMRGRIPDGLKTYIYEKKGDNE